MSNASFLCGLLWLVAVQSAVLSNEGGPINRVARSPHCTECESHGPPGPPVFHTHQWTGVERTADGINGVFSGAAAATDGALQTAGQAFSLASSGVGAGAGAAAGASAGVGAGAKAGVGADIGAGLKNDAGAGISARFGHESVGLNGGAGVGTGIAYNTGADVSGSQSSFGRSTGYDGQSDGGYGGRGSSGYGGSHGYGNYNGNSGFGGGQGFKSYRESHYTYGDKKRFDGQGSGSGYQGSSPYGFDRNVEQAQPSGFGGQSNARAQGSSYGNSGGYGGSNGYGSGFSGRRYDKLSSGGGFSNEQQRQSGSEGFGGNGQQLQSSGRGQWETGVGSSADASQQARVQTSSYGNGGGYGGGSNGYGSGFSGRHHDRLTAGSGFSNEQQQSQLASESVEGNEQQLQSSSGGQVGTSAGVSVDASQASSDTQSALGGAIGLASQGVQAAQQAQPSGCSTCGKSNYALSNAKSHSGNAIAVSVGG